MSSAGSSRRCLVPDVERNEENERLQRLAATGAAAGGFIAAGDVAGMNEVIRQTAEAELASARAERDRFVRETARADMVKTANVERAHTGQPLVDFDPEEPAEPKARLSEPGIAAMARARRRTEDAYRARAIAEAKAEGFREGLQAARAEAADIDPAPYAVAVEALHAAVQLVEPIKPTGLPENVDEWADQAAQATTRIADHLGHWLVSQIEFTPNPTPIFDETAGDTPEVGLPVWHDD